MRHKQISASNINRVHTYRFNRVSNVSYLEIKVYKAYVFIAVDFSDDEPMNSPLPDLSALDNLPEDDWNSLCPGADTKVLP